MMDSMISKQNSKVFLRAMEPEDLEFLYDIENDEQIWDVGTTNVPYSRNLLLDYITSSSGDIFADKQVRLMLENEDRVTIGIVDLVNFSPVHHRAELGIVIQKAYRHQGYASLALRKICEYSKNILHLHQIFAIVPENNKNCLKLMESFGFQANTMLKDWLFDGSRYCSAKVFQIFL